MIGLFDTVKNGLSSITAGVVRFGLKPIKYFIDNNFRSKVQPVAGSVVYCDLWVAVEHSGIYVADNGISNVEVTGFADSQVRLSNPTDFTSKSTMGKKIYVSCHDSHAVGHDKVGNYAAQQVGERLFYGLVFKNCHEFSSSCLKQIPEQDISFWGKLWGEFTDFFDPEWEFTIRQLKRNARLHLGANKWRLWDWDGNAANEPEPDWQAQQDYFQQQALTPEFIRQLRYELLETRDYEQEIADENIPKHIRQKLHQFRQNLEDISDTYQKAEAFLNGCPEAKLSFNDLQNSPEDFALLAKEMAQNQGIRELVRKMGRNYVSEEIKQRVKVPTRSRSEVHGVALGNDLMRMLPNEMALLDDETLETLFYSRLLESQLQCYELQGISLIDEEQTTQQQKAQTGPVVACLDTSSSMAGEPLIKAKAALFAIANILQREQRSLYVLLFSDSGQVAEFALNHADNLAGLMRFLQQGFGGGTDYETPLNRALEIIEQQPEFEKADVLMLSDGDCNLSDEFVRHWKQKKERLNCTAYSVLCNGSRTEDNFSDEILVL
ncbi:VWA domain-containing protein [Alysiella filiformis]|nr:VWA domain-containing protein [Alysiella filiformis]